MPLGEAENLLEVWREMVNPEEKRSVKYRVKRD